MLALLVFCALWLSASARPELDKGVLCEVCKAVINEASVIVNDKVRKRMGRETAVIDTLDTLCSQGMTIFKTYEFIPPTMRDGCFSLMDRHGDDIESALMAGDKAGDACEFICHETREPALGEEEL